MRREGSICLAHGMNHHGHWLVPDAPHFAGKPTMFSKINHVAIVSENYAKSALFYQAVFGMRTSDKTQTSRAQAVGDGYVGLNINPRRAGRSAGLDHFGIEVEDAETAFERMRRKYPTV